MSILLINLAFVRYKEYGLKCRLSGPLFLVGSFLLISLNLPLFPQCKSRLGYADSWHIMLMLLFTRITNTFLGYWSFYCWSKMLLNYWELGGSFFTLLSCNILKLFISLEEVSPSAYLHHKVHSHTNTPYQSETLNGPIYWPITTSASTH